MADEDKKPGLLKTRIFLLLFFGFAIVLCVTTILGTWEGQREGVIDPSQMNDPAASAGGGTTALPAAK